VAVLFDAATISAQFTTTPDPFTLSHTPAGTPRGVVAFCWSLNSGTDNSFDGAVTYGGVAMARPTNGFAGDVTAEPISVAQYFLGSGVPTGTQTLSVAHTAAASPKYIAAVTLTAAANLEVLDSDAVGSTGTNPQLTLDSGAVTAIRLIACAHGASNVGDLTVISGTTSMVTADAGARVLVSGRQTTPGSGSTTVGWTALSEDRAIVGMAIAEVAGAVTGRPVRRRRSSWPISLGA